MTGKDERHDHGRPDDHLHRLIGLGEPLPRMPENLKARIRSRLAEVEPASGRRDILFGRWAKWPLGAAVAAAFFLTVFWPGGVPNTISWADVQKHFEQIRTMTYIGHLEITTPEGKRIRDGYPYGYLDGYTKAYHKDPGLSRSEQYTPDADLDAVEPGSKSIMILKREPGRIEILTLYPGSDRAEWTTRIFRTNSPEPPSYPKHIDLASTNWRLFKEITADKTKRIGDRVINGMPAVGFTFEVPREYMPTDADGKCLGQLWAGRDDGVPLSAVVEYRNVQGQTIRLEASDIQWNVPLDESLFDLTVPAGWRLTRSRTESAEYADTGLAPGVTLQVGPAGQVPSAAAAEVAGVLRAEGITSSDSLLPRVGEVVIELKPEAAKRLHDDAEAHPDLPIVVDFNGQINVAGRLDSANPTQLSFDLTLLDLSLEELEAGYFTRTIERSAP